MTDDAPAPTQLPRDRFLAIPGGARRVGLELEFGGLTQQRAAEVARGVVGGRLEPGESGDIRLTGTDIGRLDVFLDTALRKKASGPIAEAGLEISRAVVPVELVTEPIPQAQLAHVEAIREALRVEGATGTGDGLFLGFGLHLNVETAEDGAADVPRVGTAFAFLEDWLREMDPIDLSRRVLPFTQRYPRDFLDGLAAAGLGLSTDDFFGLYAAHVPDRNRGLDLLPVFRDHDEARFVRAYGGETSVSGRPAYHYRLPDCRIDEADWSIAYEWNRWAVVERAARDEALLERLTEAWRTYRADLLAAGWGKRAAALLAETDVLAEAAR